MPIRSTQSSSLSLSHLPCFSLLLAPQQGGSKYPWSDGRIVASFVFFGILIISFVAIQIWKGALDATVSPRILMQRSITAGTCFGISSGGAVFLFVYYILLHPQMVSGHRRSLCYRLGNQMSASHPQPDPWPRRFCWTYHSIWLLHSSHLPLCHSDGRRIWSVHHPKDRYQYRDMGKLPARFQAWFRCWLQSARIGRSNGLRLGYMNTILHLPLVIPVALS